MEKFEVYSVTGDFGGAPDDFHLLYYQFFRKIAKNGNEYSRCVINAIFRKQ